jgi:hypothetical protein
VNAIDINDDLRFTFELLFFHLSSKKRKGHRA